MTRAPSTTPQISVAVSPRNQPTYESVVRACKEQGERENRRVTVTEWMWDAARRKLADTEKPSR